jgi:hypothetical protein
MGLGPPGRLPPGLHDQAWHYLLGLGPDLAFLQETLPSAWVRREGTLIEGPVHWWGSAIFSRRYPLDPFRLSPDDPLRRLGSYLAFGVVGLPDGIDAFVVSVHTVAERAIKSWMEGLDPISTARGSVGHANVNDVVVARLAPLVEGRRFLLAGDWNVARGEDDQYPGHPGTEFFERTDALGWRECLIGPEQRTWFGHGRPYQDDHVFCDGRLRDCLKSDWVAEEAVHLGLSDHAPLVLDFDIAPIALEGRSRRRRPGPASPQGDPQAPAP